MNGNSDDTVKFSIEDTTAIAKASIEAVLNGKAYQASMIDQWCGEVVDETLKRLAELNQPFKYVVNCIIMENNGSGLNTACSCFWDNNTDGSITFRKDFQTMHCVVTVFGLAL
eukprot:c24405_g1_i1.p1 GENE.c24405_g1_i1~~c24405_g1_i1.p1  ORF type:complete len:113 (-),score=29.56 c24405_g1_i1:43-381(-)